MQNLPSRIADLAECSSLMSGSKVLCEALKPLWYAESILLDSRCNWSLRFTIFSINLERQQIRVIGL